MACAAPDVINEGGAQRCCQQVEGRGSTCPPVLAEPQSCRRGANTPQTILGTFLGKASGAWARAEAPKVFLAPLLRSPRLACPVSAAARLFLSCPLHRRLFLNSESRSLKQRVCVPRVTGAALSGARVYEAAGWLGARFPAIPGAGNPAVPAASWPAPFVWWLWRRSVRKGRRLACGRGWQLLSCPPPAMHQPSCRWRMGQTRCCPVLPPLSSMPGAATLPWHNVPGLRLPQTKRPSPACTAKSGDGGVQPLLCTSFAFGASPLPAMCSS